MLSNGQTLKHKKTNKLVRLGDVGKETIFIAEDGTKFVDSISNYTYVEDELGRPCGGCPAEGQFVDESLKKYLVSKEELLAMREKKLKEWESYILARMSGKLIKYHVKEYKGGKWHSHSSDVAGKLVTCPFADGARSQLLEDFFLKRRKAVPLYRIWSSIRKEYLPGPMVFRHTDGQLWIYNNIMSELTVIEENSMNVPM